MDGQAHDIGPPRPGCLKVIPVPVSISGQLIGVAGGQSPEHDRFAVFGDKLVAFDGHTTELAEGDGGAGEGRAQEKQETVFQGIRQPERSAKLVWREARAEDCLGLTAAKEQEAGQPEAQQSERARFGHYSNLEVINVEGLACNRTRSSQRVPSRNTSPRPWR